MDNLVKTSDLLPSTVLQPHQQRVLKKLKEHPGGMLLYHSLGSGKTLSSIAAAEQLHEPYTAIVPASLRANYRKEQEHYTDQQLPSQIMSYSGLARKHPVTNTGSVIFDEAHRLRNPRSKQTIEALNAANRSKQPLLLTGTPVVNDPADFAPLMSILTKNQVTPEDFRNRYVKERKVNPSLLRRILGATPGIEEELTHEDELKGLLKGHVDYYAPPKPQVPVQHEDVETEMSGQQSDLYKAMWGQLPWILRWKLKNQFPLGHDELKRLTSFLTGPRQVGLSTLPFMRANANPLKAFDTSPKLTKAFELLQSKLVDPRTKALIFSNFIEAGLKPYSAALDRAKIPHALFHGGLSDAQRKQLVEDYNTNKIRVALLAPSGTEGLSFKGTQAMQLLDPYWNKVRGQQSEGRGIRYNSHFDLPEELRNVTVQRFISKLPLGFTDRLLAGLGFDREAKRLASDDYLQQLSAKKEKLNEKFLSVLKDVGS
jgi:SNF2 family DNA or RNA helicase